jgi:hypothetical protein
VVLTGVYALRDGTIAGRYDFSLGKPAAPPPTCDCLAVYLMSDSEGHFGHHCPECGGYWRSGPWPNMCPYCALELTGHPVLSKAQMSYVKHYCDVLWTALNGSPGDHEIDLDSIVDGSSPTPPGFQSHEQSQQRQFVCRRCTEFNDVLGRFAYCSSCGTRNCWHQFERETIPAVRNRANSGADGPTQALRDGVAAWDAYVEDYVRHLVKRVPLTTRRRAKLKGPFHEPRQIAEVLEQVFDIRILDGMASDDVAFTQRQFFRRHVHEHRASVVDQMYLDKTGDVSVALGQHIREEQGDVHRVINSLLLMASNLHHGFHEILPPLAKPIEVNAKKREYLETAERKRAEGQM